MGWKRRGREVGKGREGDREARGREREGGRKEGEREGKGKEEREGGRKEGERGKGEGRREAKVVVILIPFSDSDFKENIEAMKVKEGEGRDELRGRE